MRKWSFGHAKSWIFINFTWELQCRRVFRLFRKSIETSQKMYAKMAPKRIQNRASRRLGARFLRFWEACGRCQILMSFGDGKKWAKNWKISTLGRPKAKIWHPFWAALGIGQKVLGIWNWNYNVRLARTAPLRSSGGGGFIACAHSAGPKQEQMAWAC